MSAIWRWLLRVVAWLFGRASRPSRRPARLPEPSPKPAAFPGRREPSPYKALVVEEKLDSLAAAVCYVIGEDDHRCCVAFLCPCGCGAPIVLATVPDTRPRWQVEVHSDRTVTLRPSVNRQVGCRSHFVMRRGIASWCRP